MAETALIRVTQLPVIEGAELLQAVKAEWEQKAADMESLAPTEENKQTIKEMRAAERKRRNEIWENVKAVIEKASEPAKTLRAVFDDCVGSSFERLDASAKAKVDSIEAAQKAGALEQCKSYYMELCAVHGVDFVPWEMFVRLKGFKVSMTEAKKKTPGGHFNEINEFLSRVACDMDAIGDDAETAAEYKANGLNLARAQKTIRDRQEAQEAERKAAEERAERQKREAEAVARVEAAVHEPPIAIAPPEIREYAKYLLSKEQEPPKETGPIKTRFFRFYATDAQFEAIKPELKALVQKMKAEGIRYE